MKNNNFSFGNVGGQQITFPNKSGSFINPGNSMLIETIKAQSYMIRLINKTGSPTVKGSVVSACTTVDNAFELQSNEFDAIGVVAENGVADGSLAHIIISGIADVLFKDGVAAVRGYVALSADTNGRATCIQVPDINPVVAEHFKEIGHVIESKDAGTDVLAKCVLHFN